AIVRTAAYTGLRQGELRALRWADVDFTRGEIVVSRALSAGVEGETKGREVRSVPLTSRAREALEGQRERSAYTASSELVFCGPSGTVLDESALRRRYENARDAAGLRPLRFHDLRHTFGSLLAADGMDLVSVQALMGHSQLSTTERYLHARPASELAKR